MDASGQGGGFYEADGVRDAYLRHRHDGVRSPNTVMEEPAFIDALGSVAGCRALDLGCGDGATAKLILGRGAASYVGLDGSAGMIDEARRRVSDDRATLAHGDIEDLKVGVGEFDVVISRMALHYVEQLDAVFDRVHRALKEGGRLVFSVLHPVITSHDNTGDGPRTSWQVDGYFDRGPRERAWFGSTVALAASHDRGLRPPDHQPRVPLGRAERVRAEHWAPCRRHRRARPAPPGATDAVGGDEACIDGMVQCRSADDVDGLGGEALAA